MDIDAITTAVEKALARMPVEDKLVTSEEQIPSDDRKTNIYYELGKNVLTILEDQPEFGKGKSLMINSFNGATGFHCHVVAPMLIREAWHRKSAKGGVRWLEKVLKTEKGEGILVQTLWGITSNESISLTENIDLLPFNLLPTSRQKKQLTSIDLQHMLSLPLPPFAWTPPTTALVEKIEVRPFLIDATKPYSAATGFNKLSELDEFRLCLTLEGPSIILPGPSWFQYLDPDLEAALLGVSTSFSNLEVLPLHVPTNLAVNPLEVPALIQAYQALTQPMKHRIHIAAERLHQALIRRRPADQALEISIALETLLVNNPGEHTFKIALRAALLTSNEIEARIKNRAIIEATYGMRSALMHSGHTSDEFKVADIGKRPAGEIVANAAIITARVIKRIMMNNDLPDWRQFELSNGAKWK